MRQKSARVSQTQRRVITRRRLTDKRTESANRSAPTFVTPLTATRVHVLPEGNQWVYEVKLDGYRALLLKNGAQVQLRSRNDKRLIYSDVESSARRLNADTVTLDGEIVALDAAGRPSFQALQHRSAHPTHSVVYYAFDVLHLNGEDLRRVSLEERRARLPALVKGTGVLMSETLPGTSTQVIAAVQRLGLEGVIAKRRDSRYDASQRGAWVKLKLDKQQEFVVGGYRPGAHGVDALLVGYYDGRSLTFAGKVRAGFTPHVRREVFAALAPIAEARCPFVDLPNSRTSHWGAGVTVEEMSEMEWVRPRLVAQIRFVEWTADGHLRHAAFLGLRSDKAASTVRRET